MPTEFNDPLQQQLRAEAEAYLQLQQFVTGLNNDINSERDRIDRELFNIELANSVVQQSQFAKRNAVANKLFQERIQNQSKNRPTSDSDLSKQLDHLEEMGYYARPTRFSFFIEGLSPRINDRLIRNCISASLPGRSLMTQGFKIYGNPLEQVYEVNYATEINMTFRVGEDMAERDLFESWMNTAISYNTSDLNYPDDYMTTMRIYQLDRKDGYLYCIRLNNVFCKTLADMDFSSDSSDQVQTIQVALAYSDFSIVGKTSVENLSNDFRLRSGSKIPRSRAELNRTTRNDQRREQQNLDVNTRRQVEVRTAIPNDLWRYLNQY
jgi:hypothetical protein